MSPEEHNRSITSKGLRQPETGWLLRLFGSIAVRISLSIVAVVAATAITVGLLVLREGKETLELELRDKGRYLAELMTRQVIEPVLYEEWYHVFSLLDTSVKGEGSLIVYGKVYDKNGEVMASAYKDDKLSLTKMPHMKMQDAMEIREDNESLIYHISMPITAETLGTVGFLRLGITKEPLYKTLEDVKRKLYFLASAVTLAGILFGLYMARKILRPILILNKGVRRIGEGKVGEEVAVTGEGEIRELSLSFNWMSRMLKQLIDDIKAAQEHLIRTEKLYAVGEFSAGVAHEIKNPLTSIKMLIQNVKHKEKALSLRDVEIIEGEIKRIDRIVREFLAFARPGKIEKTDVDVNDVLEDVIAVTNPKMEQSSITLKKSLSSSLPVIKGNRDALKQAFMNIVLNAIQAMNKGGSVEMVTINNSEPADNAPKVTVIIKDTGAGIPGENLKKIFDPFFTTKEEGTGMGLALTHNIISDHSGKIEVESSPGNWTTVKVELPV